MTSLKLRLVLKQSNDWPNTEKFNNLANNYSRFIKYILERLREMER